MVNPSIKLFCSYFITVIFASVIDHVSIWYAGYSEIQPQKGWKPLQLLVTSDHVFMFILHICVSSLKKCHIKSFSHFLKLRLLGCTSLHSLDITPTPKIWFVNFYLPLCFAFSICWLFFWSKYVYSDVAQFIIVFCFLYLWYHTKKSLSIPWLRLIL